LAVTDWRLRRWRLWFLALLTATRNFQGVNIRFQVLGKFPVVQHVLFGSLLPFKRASRKPPKRTFQHSLDHMVSGTAMRPPPPLNTLPSIGGDSKARSAAPTTLVTIPPAEGNPLTSSQQNDSQQSKNKEP